MLSPLFALVAAEAVMVTEEEDVLVGSAELVAVIVASGGEGTAIGAVYSPAPLIVPHAAALHPPPCTAHVTAVFEVPTTEALKCCVVPTTTEALAGVAVTTMTGTMVTVADAVLFGSAMLVAATVTLGGEGATMGAVYTATNEVVASDPQEAALQPAPLKLHATAGLATPVTLAVKESVAAVGTTAVDGVILSRTAAAATRVTLAEADLVESATLVTMTLSVAGEGTLTGGV